VLGGLMASFPLPPLSIASAVAWSVWSLAFAGLAARRITRTRRASCVVACGAAVRKSLTRPMSRLGGGG
jgi:hypothetical protein